MLLIVKHFEFAHMRLCLNSSLSVDFFFFFVCFFALFLKCSCQVPNVFAVSFDHSLCRKTCINSITSKEHTEDKTKCFALLNILEKNGSLDN